MSEVNNWLVLVQQHKDVRTRPLFLPWPHDSLLVARWMLSLEWYHILVQGRKKRRGKNQQVHAT